MWDDGASNDLDWDDDVVVSVPWYRRFLAKTDDVRIDYSVLSVGVLTLGLIMVVEVIRHRLDHAATGRPFFRAVLEGVYAELATLGIVEFVVYLVQEYAKNLNTAKKAVFTDVHFLLFYTAILNAFQSVLVAFVSSRISHRIWVETEMLEINHYIEIREEFAEVKEELERLRRGAPKERKAGESSSTSSDEQQQEERRSQRGRAGKKSSSIHESVEMAFEFNRRGVVNLWNSLVDLVKYPHVKRKYNSLLLQIRFHELRVHFLQAYKLPLNLRISDYLIRSERHVLIKLVHVSSVAWLLLTGGINLLYYVLGMVSYNTGDYELVGTALIWIYFWSVGIFVIISGVVYNKMRSIFRAIMHEKTLWDVNNVAEEEKEKLAKQQLNLFWGGDPSLVIAAIQFMQFGYAVAISTVIIFWKEIDDGPVAMGWYIFIIAICYGIFVFVTGQAIPRYTLCTSLGQLVNDRRLQETLALFRLEEAQQAQLEQLELMAIDDSIIHEDFNRPPGPGLEPPADPLAGAQQVQDSTVHSKTGTQLAAIQDTSLIDQAKQREADSATLLWTSIPESEQRRLDLRREERQRRKARRKVVSDGVAAMAAMGRGVSAAATGMGSGLSAATEGIFGGKERAQKQRAMDDFEVASSSKSPSQAGESPDLLEAGQSSSHHQRRPHRRLARSKAVSDGVALMAGLSTGSIDETGNVSSLRNDERQSTNRLAFSRLPTIHDKSPPSVRPTKSVDAKSAVLLAELVKLDTDSLRTSLPESERKRLDLRKEERKRRSTRRKAKSEGVAAMAAMGGGRGLSAAAEDMLGQTGKVTPRRTVDDFNVSLGSLCFGQNKSSEMKEPKGRPLARPRFRPSRSKAGSDGVAFMARLTTRSKAMSDGVASMARVSSEAIEDFGRKAPVKSFQEKNSKGSTLGVSQSTQTVLTSPEKQEQEVLCKSPPPLLPQQRPPEATAPLSVPEHDPLTTSIHSTSSEAGYSDADDVPEVDASVTFKQSEDYTPRLSWRAKVRAYFLSRKYVVISNVFGTMVAFFMVGQRVEGFLHSEAIVSNEFVTFEFSLTWVFWILTVWLLMFLIASGLTFYALQSFSSLENNTERKVYISSVLDAVLCATCLTVLFVAEAKRCCEPVDEDSVLRYLAAEDNGADEYDKYGDPAPCSCPRFGERRYGGLGKIEPYTSLVALRVFRHYIAKRIAVYLDSIYSWSAKDEVKESHHVVSTRDPFAVFGDKAHDGCHHGKELDEDERAKVAELWESAIGKHPEIVAQYGEFSGELLRAMLGVPVVAPSLPFTDGETPVDAEKEQPAAFSLDKEYEGLSAEAQEVILAGKLGRSVVKSASQMNLTAIKEEETTANEQRPGMPSLPSHNLLFELDTRTAETDSTFRSPNARLVRSMRRCDRMLLPILDKWTVVDVVMTRFEMVYFDVSDIDKNNLGAVADGTREALIATKGGKGLRLCDVAAGRRVVGCFRLSEIESVHVKRMMPGGGEVRISESPDLKTDTAEFWKRSSAKTVDGGGTHNFDWSTIKQDQLKVQMVHGSTLLLRFYADLEDAEHHLDRQAHEDEEVGPLFKNNAFQWAQTIGRFCGPDQLKQSLPHFGSDSSDELRDYLVVHSADKGKGHRRKNSISDPMFRFTSRKSLHRASSLGNIDAEVPSSGASSRHSHCVSLDAAATILKGIGGTGNESSTRRNLQTRSAATSAEDSGDIHRATKQKRAEKMVSFAEDETPTVHEKIDEDAVAKGQELV